MPVSIKRVCNLCEAMCGLTIEMDDHQNIKSIRGNHDDIFSRGAFCPKSQGLYDLYKDPDRLRSPLKKTPNGYQKISWNQAFDEIAAKVKELQTKHGRSSIASYVGNPNVHNFSSLMTLPAFLRALQTPNHYSATSVDQLPHMLVASLMYGHQLLLPIPDVDHTEYMLILGANPAVSNGSLLSSPGLSSRLKGIQSRGGKVVVVDPRYTETASLASNHIYIRPGTDAFFLAGIVKRIIEKSAIRLGRLENHVIGKEQLPRLFSEIKLETIIQVTGISREVIETITNELLSAKRAICYGRMGVSTQAFGTVCQWLINLINILTGNFDQQGGVLFTKPAFDVVELMAKTGAKGRFAKRRSRVRNLPEFSGEFPSITLAEEILTPGKGQIKGLFTIAGNPVLSIPNGRKLETALEQLELYVAIDIYQNETTRFAHYILPPTSILEHSHFDIVLNALASRNTVRYSSPVFRKEKDQLDDGEILLELWARLGTNLSWRQQKQKMLTKALIRRIGFERILDLGLRFGPYRGEKLSLKRLIEKPDGIDLGPLEPSIPKRLYTKDQKIHLAPKQLLEAWRQFRAAEEQMLKAQENIGDRLVLIGRRNLRSNNSWMHNCQSLVKNKNQCYMLIHKEDAASRNINEQAVVTVSTSIGSIDIPVKITDRIMPGVVSIPHGWGHHRKNLRLHYASAHPGVSINDITDDCQIDEFSGTAILNGQMVKVALKTREEKSEVPAS